MRAGAHLLCAVALLAPLAATGQSFATRPNEVTEPTGLYQGALHGYTPKTLLGATVFNAATLERSLEKARPILIDVAEADRRPPDMATSAVWLPQHRSISGAIWMPDAGSGTSDAAFEAAFRSRVNGLTNGRHDQPLVVFCHPECWASYNAAKRLVKAGYDHVGWYPDGLEGWQQDHATIVITADPRWARFISTQTAKSN